MTKLPTHTDKITSFYRKAKIKSMLRKVFLRTLTKKCTTLPLLRKNNAQPFNVSLSNLFRIYTKHLSSPRKQQNLPLTQGLLPIGH